MSEIVNLRARRKQVIRAKKRNDADENAMKFGRSKAQVAFEEALAKKSRAALDAHRCEEPEK